MVKICLACSAGGHLSEMLQLRDFYGKKEHFFITFKRKDTESLSEKENVFFAELPGRNPIATIKSFFQSINVLRKENPEVIVSTGADVGLVVCVAGKILGKKIVFIESFCRPTKPGISGKIAYLFSDLFIYQWKELEKYYPKGVYGGSIF
ncbi:MAG: polysaccharide biosynthesis protein [Candidatus Diapherotrites archaeon]|uniref:Polysaccharide biosynthesis protein n=1 Tax=Candidatus Iainarchaeum sp. TaxID=3101447 RepID=A0A2D6LQK9_9ARCH|nr:polysaccharide biosynthesis protein [Candidatus Diapherotrites archaeon]|tara:strand:- start:1263 stop:1712 length:450 start_codon:yes stop_codon:yes gene_type:complete